MVLPTFGADSGNLVPAGREDMDVRMLGTGRPFVMQVFNARDPCPSRCDLHPSGVSQSPLAR